jgi:hypothetical protein
MKTTGIQRSARTREGQGSIKGVRHLDCYPCCSNYHVRRGISSLRRRNSPSVGRVPTILVRDRTQEGG